MTDVTIRTVLPKDIKPCFKIESDCFEPSEAATEQKIAKRAEIYPEGFLVAERDGAVVGLINCGATNQLDLADEDFKDMTGHHPEGTSVAIFSLATEPKSQKMGVGTTLLKAFINRMRKNKKQSVFLICKKNLITFYERFGFIPLGKSNSTHGGFEWWEMKLKL